jgi:hypothetical protein
MRPLIISCGLALSELHFPQPLGFVSAGHAYLLVTGRIDAWPRYWDLNDADRQRLADLLSHRGDDLASEEGFNRALSTFAQAAELDGYNAPRGRRHYVGPRDAASRSC